MFFVISFFKNEKNSYFFPLQSLEKVHRTLAFIKYHGNVSQMKMLAI